MIRNRIVTIRSLTLIFCLGFSCEEPGNKGSAISGWEKMGEDPQEEEPQKPKEEEPQDPEDPYADCWFKTRGIVAGWGDVYAPSSAYKIDYLGIAREHGLNTFSIYRLCCISCTTSSKASNHHNTHSRCNSSSSIYIILIYQILVLLL